MENSQIYIFHKKVIAFSRAFVYNVFCRCLGHQGKVWRAWAFPKGDFFIMYTVNSIRNVVLLGHSGSGKSALAESLLYISLIIGVPALML